jgi:hypothetical protein
VDLVTKAVGVLAGILGLAGYVLLLGAAILWLRLNQVELPTDVPVSMASREELLTIGAQAVAVWVILVGAVGALAGWIITGTSNTRPFGPVQAILALSLAPAMLLGLGTWPPLLILPAAAVVVAVFASLKLWTSSDEVAALLIPAAVAVAVGAALSLFDNGNRMALTLGVVLIFGALAVLATRLQEWREVEERTAEAKALMDRLSSREETPPDLEVVAAALERGSGQARPPVLVWIKRVGLILLALFVLGSISIASQVDSNRDFHQARVRLSDGACLAGAYVARGSDSLIIGQPARGQNAQSEARITTIPTGKIEEVQVYGKPADAIDLERHDPCKPDAKDHLPPTLP